MKAVNDISQIESLIKSYPVCAVMIEIVQGEGGVMPLEKEYVKEKYNKPGNVYIGLIHRLDRPVSGVMVFAKTSKAASRLSDQVRIHSFKKKYMALVYDNGLKDEDKFINGSVSRGYTREVAKKVFDLVNINF